MFCDLSEGLTSKINGLQAAYNQAEQPTSCPNGLQPG